MSNDIPIPEYDYEVVSGWFMQDEPQSLIHELPHGFGLLDPSEQGWTKLKEYIKRVNGEERVPGTIHKLFFFARHGEGLHNVGEALYGTAEWDRYWSKLNGNGEIVWGPDPDLTSLGVQQAQAANAMWREQIKLSLPAPDVIYTSPFRRAIHTSIVTFNGWFYPSGDEPGMEASKSVQRIVIEDLHETAGEHTCDMRSTKAILQNEYPSLIFENGFVEEDPLWDPDRREPDSEQDIRARKALDKMVTAEGTYISVSSHSGTMSSLFRNLGHRPYYVTPGGVVPVLVKATQRTSK